MARFRLQTTHRHQPEPNDNAKGRARIRPYHPERRAGLEAVFTYENPITPSYAFIIRLGHSSFFFRGRCEPRTSGVGRVGLRVGRSRLCSGIALQKRAPWIIFVCLGVSSSARASTGMISTERSGQKWRPHVSCTLRVRWSTRHVGGWCGGRETQLRCWCMLGA